MNEDVICDLDESYSKPEPPSEFDCCNTGCNPCVYDLYEKRLAEWKNRDKFNRQTVRFRKDLLSDTSFKPFVLLEKCKMTRQVYFFKFQPSVQKFSDSVNLNGNESKQSIPGLLPYKPGQHFIMRSNEKHSKEFPVADKLGRDLNKPLKESNQSDSESVPQSDPRNSSTSEKTFVCRAYTPISISSEEENCVFHIIVKLYDNGIMSKCLSELCVGDIAYFRGPYGNFEYVSNSYRSILMICMGTGITPLYAIAKSILSNESDETIIKLLYGCKCAGDIILRDELRNMALFWNFSVEFCVTDIESNVNPKFGENFSFSRINGVVILKELNRKGSQLFLICGSQEFSETVLNILLQNGIENKNIHVF